MLDVLSCPSCKNSTLIEKESTLKCETCNLIYEVKNGIPILLPKKVGTK